jgi:outer membrane immunogenic protein
MLLRRRERLVKKFLLASSAIIGFAAPASAADLPLRMSVKAPVVAAVPFSWTGCYAGAHAGYGWGRENFEDPTANFTANAGDSLRVRSEGALAGGQIGCNYQFASHWVVGLEGQYSWADIKGDATEPDLFFDGKNLGGKNLASKTDALASITGRLGYTFDRVMLYGKGGGAWAQDRYNEHQPAVGFPFNFAGDNLSARVGRYGWTVGAGVEWAFADKWSAKIEYDHYDFGSRSLNLISLINSTGVPTNVAQRIDTVTVGINYRFWSPTNAIAARY